MKNEIIEINAQPAINLNETGTVFANKTGFEFAMKMAEQLSKSDIVPATYKNKPENCLIALEMSHRLGSSPFLIMQNMHIIQGRPSWSSTFIIAAINSSGKFKGSLKFEMDEAKTKCRAYAIDKLTDEKLTGPTVTIEMADKEGWLSKTSSKWKTMPELMLRYRAAAFFGRLYVPEILNGMQTEEEVYDTVTPVKNEVINPFDNEVKTDVIN